MVAPPFLGGMKSAALLAAVAMLACRPPPATAPARPARLTYFVAHDGDDRWSGLLPEPNASRTDGPFASLERARDQIRTIKRTRGLPAGGISVTVRGGRYELVRPFTLDATDSGTAGAPVDFSAAPGERVILDGGRQIADWRPVTDTAVVQRLDPAARGHVVVANLRVHAITDYGRVDSGGLELFASDQAMTIARWPNEGFTHIVRTAGNDPVDVRGNVGDRTGKLVYEGDRPSRWTGEPDAWVHGYWFWDWSDEREPIAAVDPVNHVLELEPPYHRYGYRAGQWFYAFNLLAELDRPGEWYLDRTSGLLYFWPPEDSRETEVSVLPQLLVMENTSFVTFSGVVFEHARGTAIAIHGGSHDAIDNCTVRDVGGWAVTIHDATASGVAGTEITGTGEGGIEIEAGDRAMLVDGDDYALDNHIHHWSRWQRTYRPAVRVAGVGNHVAHNLIHDAPHEAIEIFGNDHVVELNEIHHVCLESNDAGAIVGGRDWTMRGTVIRNNFLHDISGFADRGAFGVGLDDMFSGTEIVGNVFYRVSHATSIGGGRDNTIANNLFVDCTPAVFVDARGLGWAASTVDELVARLRSVPYRSERWAKRYPRLAAIDAGTPAAPEGNRVEHNVAWHGVFDGIQPDARKWIEVAGNVTDIDPRIIDAAHGDFRLQPDSPVYATGFRPIPFKSIGPRPHREAR